MPVTAINTFKPNKLAYSSQSSRAYNAIYVTTLEISDRITKFDNDLLGNYTLTPIFQFTPPDSIITKIYHGHSEYEDAVIALGYTWGTGLSLLVYLNEEKRKIYKLKEELNTKSEFFDVDPDNIRRIFIISTTIDFSDRLRIITLPENINSDDNIEEVDIDIPYSFCRCCQYFNNQIFFSNKEGIHYY